MGSFNGFILTNNGKKLLDEALMGKRLIFTKFQFGDGESTEDPKEVKKMVNVNKETTINQIENNGNGQVMLRVIINNKDVDNGFYIKEIGVFARCEDGEEILYAYNKAMKPDYLPVYNGINLVELEYQNYITIAQIEDVTAIIDENFTYLTKEEANEKFVKQTQLALEENPGIITLNEVYEAGMPFRGVFPFKNKKLTYNEVMAMKDGVYSVEGPEHFTCLNIAHIGKGMHDRGIFKKRTFKIFDKNQNATKQNVLEYIPHNYSFGVTSTTMHFWDNMDFLNKELNTSFETSGCWTTNIGWDKINITDSGYAKMSNGLTVQWGKMLSSINSTDYKYFPISFDNEVFMGVASYSSFDSSGMGASFQKVDRSRFLLGCRLSNGNLIAGQIQWIAIGY
jgi:hypothetical protein